MALTTERIKELWDAYRAALPRYLGFAKAIAAGRARLESKP